MKKYTSLFLGLILAVIPSVAVAQWTGPSASPPNANVPAPLNVGAAGQAKTGGLILNTGNATNGLIVQYGKVGIGLTSPGYKLEVAGNVAATAFFYTSDISLKTNIAPLSDSLEKISKLQGVSFQWKKDQTKSVGLIAQDVEKVYPDLVHTDKTTGIKSLEYGNLVAPLIEAIKEQQKEIESLKADLYALKNK